MSNNKELNDIVRIVKELFIKAKDNRDELSKLIDKYLIPSISEKKGAAEISTPYKLREEMLDKIPNIYWTKPRKTLEPCAGKGGFLIDITERFMKGLESMYPDAKERYQVIVEKCLYFSDINPLNIFIAKLLLDPKGEYKLNYNKGDTLKLDISKKWGIEGFSAVIGNPPYNNLSGTGGSRKLWDKFVYLSINICKQNGFVLLIHPPNWRKPENKILEEVKKYNLISLNMLSEKEGIKYFKCSTKIDYYLLQKNKYRGYTMINDILKIDISNLDFIPNQDFELFDKINGHMDIICPNTSYSSDMKWMKDDQNLKYKYILSINKNEIKYKYSNELKNYVNNKKVIVSLGRYPYPYNDYKGEYGMSCYNFGIPINSKEEGENIVKCINSEKFLNLLKVNKWGSYNIEWRMFKYFKSDFWKEFN